MFQFSMTSNIFKQSQRKESQCCYGKLRSLLLPTSVSKWEGYQVQTLMQLERLSTNRCHLARVEVFVVLCVISPYFIIALPHFSKLVNVTFGNFTSVTIMSNKVIAFKFPFESAGPHSTESNDLSKYFKVQFRTVAYSLTKKWLLTPLWRYQTQKISHTYAQIPSTKVQKGLQNQTKINLIDKVSYPSEWDVNLQIELSHHQISPSCGSSHLGLGLCLHHQTRRNFSFHVKTRIDSKIKNKLTCPSDSCDKCALHIAVNMQQTQVWNFRLWRLGQSRWHLLLSRSS